MGTTLSAIHIYSPDAVDSLADFHTFSEGWQTYLPAEEPENPFVLQTLAKKLSRSIDAPVLWFYIFDSDYLIFEFYKNGRKVAAHSQADSEGSKGLYSIPGLIGYGDGQKRRLSNILSCADIEQQLALLEEYFGVCLLPMADEPAAALSRNRDDKLYQAYLAEEKKLTGKRSPVKAELIWEQTGKIFSCRFGDADGYYRRACYYFGYDTFESNFENGALRTVGFSQGQLIPITQAQFDVAPKFRYGERPEARFTQEIYPIQKIHFTDKAPDGLKNKTLLPPKGFYILDFDEKGRAILYSEQGRIIIVDETLKAVAKLRVKGEPVEYADGYILTAGSESFFAYYYNPSNKIRVYRLCDK